MIERIRPSKLLEVLAHRSSPLPSGRWNFFQEWHNAIFLHYQVDPIALRGLVPRGLELDLFEERAWISVVAFTMRNVRPHWLPAWSAVSDFHEVNVRTYVQDGSGNPGVYFLSIDAEKWASVALARILSTLPYRKAIVRRGMNSDNWFEAKAKTGMHLKIDFRKGNAIPGGTNLDRWLVERYSLFETYRNSLWSYRIHHLPWPLKTLHIDQLQFVPSVDTLPLKLTNGPALAHWSDGVRILSWPRLKVSDRPSPHS